MGVEDPATPRVSCLLLSSPPCFPWTPWHLLRPSSHAGVHLALTSPPAHLPRSICPLVTGAKTHPPPRSPSALHSGGWALPVLHWGHPQAACGPVLGPAVPAAPAFQALEATGWSSHSSPLSTALSSWGPVQRPGPVDPLTPARPSSCPCPDPPFHECSRSALVSGDPQLG